MMSVAANAVLVAVPVGIALFAFGRDWWAERRDQRNTARVLAAGRAFRSAHARYLATPFEDCARCRLGGWECECDGPWAVWPLPEEARR